MFRLPRKSCGHYVLDKAKEKKMLEALAPEVARDK